jgi:hypothetical protein
VTGVPTIRPGCGTDARPSGPTGSTGPRVQQRSLSSTPSIVISDAAPGTTYGNHRPHFHRHTRTSPDMVSAVQVHEPTLWAGRYSGLIPPYKRGVTGSNPVAPTRSGHMLILTGNIRGNHRCTPLVWEWWWEWSPRAVAGSSSITRPRHQLLLVSPHRRQSARRPPGSRVGLRLPDPPATAHRRPDRLLQRKDRHRRSPAAAGPNPLLQVTTTHRKPPSLTRGSFHGVCHSPGSI